MQGRLVKYVLGIGVGTAAQLELHLGRVRVEPELLAHPTLPNRRTWCVGPIRGHNRRIIVELVATIGADIGPARRHNRRIVVELVATIGADIGPARGHNRRIIVELVATMGAARRREHRYNCEHRHECSLDSNTLSPDDGPLVTEAPPQFRGRPDPVLRHLWIIVAVQPNYHVGEANRCCDSQRWEDVPQPDASGVGDVL